MTRNGLQIAARTLALALGLAPFACGGESSSDGSGGSGGTTSGGTTSGGSSGTGGNVSGGGGTTSGGSGGAGGCKPQGDGGACQSCGGYVPPICENGAWTCPPQVPCADAAPDGNPSCPANQVPTTDGCLTCADASSKLYAAIEASRTANAACGTAADCMLTGSSTTCSGACQIAVSKSGESAFLAALAKLDSAYCSGFVPVCGYSTPKCAVPTLECTNSLCSMKFN